MVTIFDSPDFIYAGNSKANNKSNKLFFFIKGAFVGLFFDKLQGRKFTNFINILFKDNIKFKNNLYSKELKNNHIIYYPNKRITRVLGNEEKFFSDLYETYMLNLINFNDGDKVVDIGANVGEINFSLKFKKLDFEYIAFEPDPVIYNCLLKNIGSSQGLHNVALSDKNSEDKFFIDSAGADSSLIDFGNNEFIKVTINKLDDYKIKNIKLLKIEAEGAEPEVLSGAIATLKNTEYISVDYGNERGKDGLSTVVEVVNILISNNFEFIGDSNLRKVGLFRNRSFQI